MFSNTKNQESTKGDDESEMTVTREGDFTESGLDVMEEINIFEGAENRITFQQVYSKTLKCVYQLQLYPFDTQVLSLSSHMNNLCNICMSSFVLLTWRSESWRGPL